ncbi:DUF6053 domain-containing protein [Lysobacter enzymogenes]|uniref:DUF6053 domain-containing protein n=1 Tax=Lysobacter enzymogenes TaxID=69 RepID=UPI003D189B8E
MPAVVGGASAPTLLCPLAATRAKSIGTEVPPTRLPLQRSPQKTPAEAGVWGLHRKTARIRRRESDGAHQKVTLQLSILPVSCPARSATRSFQAPLSASLDRFLV